MKIVARKKQTDQLPGLTGTARVDRHTKNLLPRVRTGDIVLVDHLDLDRSTAQALLDRGVVAVVNAGPFISGRYANLGPRLLAAAGVRLLENVGPAVLQVKDGSPVRLDQETLFVDGVELATGRVLDAALVETEMDAARRGMLAQLATFTHNSTEFLQREEPLLLHGEGLPRLDDRLRARPVVVCGADRSGDLVHLRRYVTEQRPVLVGVGVGVAQVLQMGWTPDVVVLDQHEELPDAKILGAARAVVLRVEPGAAKSVTEPLERIGLRPLRVETNASTSDLALLLAAHGEAPLVIAAGLDASLDEFLDSRRQGLASAFLTRLKVGELLVDANAVPALYSGRVRPRHLFLLLLVGLIALAAAISVTPVGQEWAHDLAEGTRDLFDSIQGKFS